MIQLSKVTIVPQGEAVANLRRREDELNLTPGNAVGTGNCHARRHRSGPMRQSRKKN